jgi:uncharacterized protein (DUF4415 family)
MPRYRKDELPAGRTDWERAARSEEVRDPENPEWTRESFREADLVTPGGLTRTPVCIRMYTEVLDHYRSLGRGYQTRINDDLLELVRRRQSRAGRATPIRQRRVTVIAGSRWEDGQAATPRAS